MAITTSNKENLLTISKNYQSLK